MQPRPRLLLPLKFEEVKYYLALLKRVAHEKSNQPLISADLVYRQWQKGEAVQNWISWIPRLKAQPGWSWAELKLLKQLIFCTAFDAAELDAAIANGDPITRVYEKCSTTEVLHRARPVTTHLRDRQWAIYNYENNPRAVLRWILTVNMDRLPLYDLTQEQVNFYWTASKLYSEVLSKTCPRSIYAWMQRPNIAKEIKCGSLEERARSMILFAMDVNFKPYSLCVAPLLDLSKVGQVQELNNRKWTSKQVEKAERLFFTFHQQERRLQLVIIDQMLSRLARNPLDNGALGALRSHQLFEERQAVIAQIMENPFSFNPAYRLLCRWKTEGWIGEIPRANVLVQLRSFAQIELKGMIEQFPQEVALLVSFHYAGKFRFFLQWLGSILRKWTSGCDLDGLTKYLGTYAVLWACCPTECREELTTKVPAFEAWATLFNRLL